MALKSDLLRKIEKGAAESEGVKTEAAEAFSDEKAYLERRRTEVEIEGETQNIRERKKYALCFFLLACGWVLIIPLFYFLRDSVGDSDFNFPTACYWRRSDRPPLTYLGFSTWWRITSSRKVKPSSQSSFH